MTKDEFIIKYGNRKVKFSGYYKYTFNYVAQTDDGLKITVSVGGNGDDIYRHEVFPDKEEFIHDLYPYSGQVNKDGVRVDEFYDY
jgi:hypothetical protein